MSTKTVIRIILSKALGLNDSRNIAGKTVTTSIKIYCYDNVGPEARANNLKFHGAVIV